MISSRQEWCRQEAVLDRPRQAGWWRIRITSTAEVGALLETVADQMAFRGYPDADVFAVRLAVEEAIVNAVKHGNGGDPAKEVCVRCKVGAERVLVEVEDQGRGFNPDRVPDPLALENLERSCGRGVFLMRYYLTWVRYNEQGNRVTLCKRRSLFE
jgi:serine/threonine-protein kinase RsbW